MVLELPKELTIAEAPRLRELLLAALERGEPVELDGGAVEEIDAAGLQVLCAARRSAARRGLSFTIREPGRSEPLSRSLVVAGLNHAPEGARAGEDAQCRSGS